MRGLLIPWAGQYTSGTSKDSQENEEKGKGGEVYGFLIAHIPPHIDERGCGLDTPVYKRSISKMF